MKIKVIALSLALAATMFSANAQEKPGSDVFIGVGGGVISVMNNGFNAPSFYGQIQVGKYITPVWGVRGVIGGPFQTLSEGNGGSIKMGDGNKYEVKNKLFGELNLDGMLNLSQALSKADFPKVDLYLFAGPTINFSTVGTAFTGQAYADGTLEVKEDDAFRARVGATAGLGLGVNLSKKWALALEGRVGLTPSIFGDASICRKAEGTGRVTLNAVYTFGGKNGKAGYAEKIAKAAGYLSAAEAAALAAEAVAKNPKIVEKIVEKPVEKIVEKIVEKEVPGLDANTIVFFDINKATIRTAEKARLSNLADAIKALPEGTKVAVTGYADKATGSVATNDKLSKKRAEAVADYLAKLGVNKDNLVVDYKGGVPAMFGSNAYARCSIISLEK